MKLARRISQNPMFILFLISSFLFASCSNNNDEILASNDNKLSGEEMFKQIFFMQGGENNLLKNNPTYAIHLEKVEKLNSKQKEESYKFTSELVNLMKKESPNYFNEFEIAIKSKNPEIINENLKNGGFLLQQAIIKSSQKELLLEAKAIYKQKYGNAEIKDQAQLNKITNELTKELLNNKTNEALQSKEACLTVAGVVAAVVWEVVAVVNVAAFVTALTCFWGANYCLQTISQYEDQTFTQEKLIVDIIENY